MDEQNVQQKLLIAIALILCAVLIGYNAFFIPEISAPTVIYSDNVEVEDNQTEVTSSNVNTDTRININTATKDELSQNIKGIGEVLASRIVEYREQNGNFNSIEEITSVRGIGEKLFNKIKNHICV